MYKRSALDFELENTLENTGYYPNNGASDPSVLARVDAAMAVERVLVIVRSDGSYEIEGAQQAKAAAARILKKYKPAEIVYWAERPAKAMKRAGLR